MQEEPANNSGQWRMEERRAGGAHGWTLAREIFGTILGVLAVALPFTMALVAWGSRVETKFAAHDAELIYLHKEQDVQDNRSNATGLLLDRRLERIESKVDRLVERK